MTIEVEIRALADKHAKDLRERVNQRVIDMNSDDNSHFLIYQVLGITTDEGRLIDIYQNKGRFLYRLAGSFLEKAAKLCFSKKFPDSGPIRISNTISRHPRNFEIDCLVNEKDAIEIKWRDATTDGDHITKEHTRIKNIRSAGFKPIRVMFYYPNREQAKRVQRTLETLYAGVNGEYYCGNAAWKYITEYTEIDLFAILTTIAQERKMK